MNTNAVRARPLVGENQVNSQGRPAGKYGWKAALGAIVQESAGTRRGHHGETRQTSYATRHNVSTGLFRLFSVLRELGFKIENPANLEGRHLQALFDWMEQRRQAGELGDATIQGYVSYLRKFCRWIGKDGLIEKAGIKFKDPKCGRRQLLADEDRSWEGRGLDIASVIDRAWELEPWVAMALLSQAAFGLRRKEAVCLRPEEDYIGAGILAVTRGTKGGRWRHVHLVTHWQYEVIATLIDFCRRDRRVMGHIGGEERDLKGNLRRYSYVLSKLGVTKDVVGTTGHGLRAGFACRMLQAYGITAPVRGGDVRAADDQARALAYSKTTEALGHSRHHVVGAYAGGVRRPGEVPHPGDIDLQRVDPPDMEGLIEKLRERSTVKKSERRLMRRVADLCDLSKSPHRSPTRRRPSKPESLEDHRPPKLLFDQPDWSSPGAAGAADLSTTICQDKTP